MAVPALQAGCYEGYLGPDGAMLQQYLEPAALKIMVDSPRGDIWIIDVRPGESFKKAHILMEHNFPSKRNSKYWLLDSFRASLYSKKGVTH